MSLAETISDIAGRLRKNSYRSETDVREAIVNRVLHELGWSIYDPTIVQREYSVEKRRVDYALFTSGGSAAVFIEVKSPTAGEEGDRQLFEYAFHQGTPFAILVNGREWSFYLPAEQGNYAERRVQKVDFLERSSLDCAAVIERYLRYDRVRDGAAYNDARADYQSEARKRDAAKAIPRAWADLVKQHDELLIALIAEKVTGLIGSRPADEQVESFLLTLGNQASALELDKTYRPPQERSHNGQLGTVPTRSAETSSQKSISSDNNDYERAEGRGLKFSFLGKTVAQNNAISALIYILKNLSARDGSFLEKFAVQAPSRTRNHISRVRAEVYPGNPDFEEYTQEILPGWWLGTNISNRDKDRLTKIACEVADLGYGQDICIVYPNAAS